MTLLNRNLHRLALLLGATLSLASCGGGGAGGGGGGNTTVTINSISPTGVVQSTLYTLYIYGTNFTNGMTIRITSTQGSTNITPSSITSGLITVTNFSIGTAPNEKYVTVNLISTNGTTTLDSTMLGVASLSRTIVADIQPIFNTHLCNTCHGSSGGLNLSTAPLSSTGLINESSTRCSQKLRVKPGDPRTSNNVLLDVLYAKSTTAVMSCNSTTSNPDRRMPQGAGAALSQPEIDIITDWIAGGAY